MRMNIDFIAIDFETATGHRDSACAIGIAVVEDLRVTETFYSLIQPPGLLFHPGNVRIHGITPDMVQNAPTLDQLWPKIAPYFTTHCPVVAHNAGFDAATLRGSCSAKIPDFPYVDSIEIAAPLVPGSRCLAHCAEVLNIDLHHHHNALDDAVACAEIAICGLQRANCLSMWEFLAQSPHVKLRRFHALPPPKQDKAAHPAVQSYDPGHPLYGKKVVFTGSLSFPRQEAIHLASDCGALVRSKLSPKTDFLVAGHQDLSMVGPSGRSSKEEKALEMQRAGAPLRIIGETEFLSLLQRK